MNEKSDQELPNTKSVFVIGAGASCEFGLPSGHALKSKIFSLFDFTENANFSGGSTDLKSALELSLGPCTTNDINRLLSQCKKIRKGILLSASIDNLIHLHRENKDIVNAGKIAIAYSILKAEAASTLRQDNFFSQINWETRGLTSPSETWLGIIFQLISTQKTFSEFCRCLKSILFISFNYDRCVEVFIFKAARALYPIEEFDSQLLFASLRVIHPYGSLGPIIDINQAQEEFERNIDGYRLLEACKNLKTFTEGIDDEDVVEKINLGLTECSSLFFLGYGFIDLNDSVAQSRR